LKKFTEEYIRIIHLRNWQFEKIHGGIYWDYSFAELAIWKNSRRNILGLFIYGISDWKKISRKTYQNHPFAKL